jgi:nitrate/nitrite-specific signal transduction histidine kinase
MGVIGMEERARLSGGRTEIRSHPGEGTTVTAYFPLASQQAPAPPREVHSTSGA